MVSKSVHPVLKIVGSQDKWSSFERINALSSLRNEQIFRTVVTFCSADSFNARVPISNESVIVHKISSWNHPFWLFERHCFQKIMLRQRRSTKELPVVSSTSFVEYFYHSSQGVTQMSTYYQARIGVVIIVHLFWLNKR